MEIGSDVGALGLSLLILLIVGIAIWSITLRSRRDALRREYVNLVDRLDSLYADADQLGQAADFLQPDDDVVLAHKIADFFAQLVTLQRAQSQVETLIYTGAMNPEPAVNAMAQCGRYASILSIDAMALWKSVNVRTGKVASCEPNAKIGSGHRVAAFIPCDSNSAETLYHSPKWIAEPIYARRVDGNALANIYSYFAGQDQVPRFSVTDTVDSNLTREQPGDTAGGAAPSKL